MTGDRDNLVGLVTGEPAPYHVRKQHMQVFRIVLCIALWAGVMWCHSNQHVYWSYACLVAMLATVLWHWWPLVGPQATRTDGWPHTTDSTLECDAEHRYYLGEDVQSDRYTTTL